MKTYWLVGKATKPMTEERRKSLTKMLELETQECLKGNVTKSFKVNAELCNPMDIRLRSQLSILSYMQIALISHDGDSHKMGFSP